VVLLYAGPPVLQEVGASSAFAALLAIAVTTIALVGILERRDTTLGRLVVLYQLR
jgi:hypothetical protein